MRLVSDDINDGGYFVGAGIDGDCCDLFRLVAVFGFDFDLILLNKVSNGPLNFDNFSNIILNDCAGGVELFDSLDDFRLF